VELSLNAGSLVTTVALILFKINDERVIYTGKSYFPSIPFDSFISPIKNEKPISPYPIDSQSPPPPYPIAQFFSASQHFNISTQLGRVGRVIRKNNTISGQIASKLYLSPTTPPTLTTSFPTWWSWHEGDREDIDIFPSLLEDKPSYSNSYFSYGFLGAIDAGDKRQIKFKQFDDRFTPKILR